MDRRAIAFCAAAAVATAMPLAAQSNKVPPSDEEITLIGCVQPNKSGGYWLTNATVSDASSAGATSTTTATTTTAPNPAATGTSGSATTTVDNDLRSAANNHMWNLGTQKDVERYVNQKVQVTGKPKNDTSGDQLKGTKGGEMQARDFDVKSVKLIASSCS